MIYTGCPEKTDALIFCYNSENKHTICKNGTCLYSQKHGKTRGKCHMACTPPGQSQQLLKTGVRCEPPSGGLAPTAARSAGDDGSVDHLGGQTGARRLRL